MLPTLDRTGTVVDRIDAFYRPLADSAKSVRKQMVAAT